MPESPSTIQPCGDRAQYALEARHLGIGGQAEVLPAIHKSTGTRVAFKRLLTGAGDDALARMRREVEVGRGLQHPHVMPVLDVAADFSWFVMPLADGNLDDLRNEVVALAGQRTVVEQVCAGVLAAHAQGWVHRDIKPHNVLRVDGLWVVADWGLVRRPAGTTSVPRTRVGTAFGTEGFAAPELSVDAHQADARADVYSVGQLIGWLETGQWPAQNVPLLPVGRPWRAVARQATQLDRERRPETVQMLLEVIERAHAQIDPPGLQGQMLLEAIQSNPSDQARIDELVELTAAHPDEKGLIVDVLPTLSHELVAAVVARRSELADGLLDAYDFDRNGRERDGRDYDWYNQVVRTVLGVAKGVERSGRWDVFPRAVESVLEWDLRWDRWRARDDIGEWLASLSGEAASMAADALQDDAQASYRHRDLADNARVDPAIRRAVYVHAR